MVTGAHPNEIDLFDYVEGDLDQARTDAVRAHVAACPECARQVERVQAGKQALRGSQFLHLPKRRIESVLMDLPTQRREPGRRPALSPKQLIAVLTPVVAVAAVIAVLASTGGGHEQEAGATSAAGGGAAAQESSGDQAGTRVPAYSVAGTATDVARALRAKGFSANVQGNAVVVHGTTKRQVREALADRAPGDVQVFVQPR
jgi:anti-sigma factor RsiW